MAILMTTLVAGSVAGAAELQFRLDACRCRVRLGSAQGAKDRTSHWLVVDHRQELQIVF